MKTIHAPATPLTTSAAARALPAVALTFSVVLAAGCDDALTGVRDTSAELEAEAMGLAGEFAPNDAPCGDNTIAIITTKENDVYVFCTGEDGDVAVMEAISSSERPSLLDEILDPVDLLKAVASPEVDVPEEVIARIKTGKLRQGTEPFRVGRPNYRMAAASKTGSACATPSLNFSPSSVFFNNTTYCGWVSGTSSSSNDADWHALSASALHANGEGSHNHAGPHNPPFEYYYADEDEEGDARYGRARVRSCGGTTRFRGWWRPSPTTGSWALIAEYYVPSGWTYTMAWYSNSQQSLWMGYDADDIRFRADALGGATFGSRFYFLKYAYGENCALKF